MGSGLTSSRVGSSLEVIVQLVSPGKLAPPGGAMSMVSQDACAWDSSAPLGGQLIIFTLYKGNNEFLFMWVSSFGKLSLGLIFMTPT